MNSVIHKIHIVDEETDWFFTLCGTTLGDWVTVEYYYKQLIIPGYTIRYPSNRYCKRCVKIASNPIYLLRATQL